MLLKVYVVGFPLADGTSAKALTGIDDHARMCVCARLMACEHTRAVCDRLRATLATYEVAEQILTDNGKVFTGAATRADWNDLRSPVSTVGVGFVPA